MGPRAHRRIPFAATGCVRHPTDQTLRAAPTRATRGSDRRDAPDAARVARAWHAHGYYGSVSHNVKAVYQRYMGWFDGNPGRLWAHPPEAIGPRYVEAIGGSTASSSSQHAVADGDFRWAATLLDHAVFTDEHHAGARALYADTVEQLAYGAENADLAQLLPRRRDRAARRKLRHPDADRVTVAGCRS